MSSTPSESTLMRYFCPGPVSKSITRPISGFSVSARAAEWGTAVHTVSTSCSRWKAAVSTRAMGVLVLKRKGW